jgi:ATP-dependent Lon protease
MNNKDLAELKIIKEKTKDVPLIIIANNVIHPNLYLPLGGFSQEDKDTLQKSKDDCDGYFVISTKIDDVSGSRNDLVYKIGTLCKITKLDFVDGEVILKYDSLFKYSINSLNVLGKIRLARGEALTQDVLVEITDDIWEVHDMVFDSIVEYLRIFNPSVLEKYRETTFASPEDLSPLELIGVCFANLNMNVNVKQSILESSDIKKNLNTILKVINIGLKLKKSIDDKPNQTIQELLNNEAQDSLNDEQDFLQKIQSREFPEEVKKIVDRDVKRLSSMSPNGSEYHSIENYLNTLYDYPWKEFSVESVDLVKTKAILENDHFGLDKVKKRIIRQLATYKLTNKKNGLIICLDGPPGVGKTSICKSIAESLNRKYVRIGLGGVSDEAEIRGHRKTYVGSMTGKIVSAIIKSKVNNPLIVLDEIDKVGQSSVKGSVEAALLEVLDPEQNTSFNDHFMNTPVDLSDVLFIATSNDISRISRPLRDRMEIIHLGSYTSQDKFHIAKKYLIPKEKLRLGLEKYTIKFNDSVISHLIDDYTRESGVRGLKKVITEIYQHCAEKILLDKKHKITISKKNLSDFLERKAIPKEDKPKYLRSGVINGLAWTPVGGEVLMVESLTHRGNGKISVTGKLGDVMKESAQIALSLVKVICEEDSINFPFNEQDIHIHFPAGATPKDGPSAGITLVSSLYSLVTNKKVKSSIAMTGEISLRGEILPVGGIKEKILGAYKRGIKTVLIPKSNAIDLEEIPEEVLNDKTFNINLVSHYKDVLSILFK